MTLQSNWQIQKLVLWMRLIKTSLSEMHCRHGDWAAVYFAAGPRNYLFFEATRAVLGPTKLIQWVMRALPTV